ncbi:prolipoprotein diacylglyceryl transferase [Spiroplasma clarkii]|uniref:Prolipoprotein diacylglyceryl transferase n=1 Tax=Spiroplasma clarkii TaxID=2139 RepID=A0A1Y0L3L1_9MOLU|nr:prolipoprotein diacylglyceryl transferase family protein [Spiroplasma clarkii]ARU92298.1 prolipoprotein diacylglyceryl transferase [Spiroplasma clarkii]ATX71608.1 prolipoprotein diacylglyceryl transferase [Spiroplasma clarkii]
METWDDNSFITVESLRTVSSDYGGFHVYAFTMTMGVIIAILFAAYQFKRKGLKIERLMMGAVGAVPAGLFGGSFFGKLGSSNSFWSLFAFWEAGMSIHGAILFGAGFGILVFYLMGRRERVSIWVYMDCILPQILVSQAVGRWGNFFNHEIFGKPAGLYNEGALSWLPGFIRDNMTKAFVGKDGTEINGISLVSGEWYVMQPIFLYESISFVILWALIVFLIPAIKYMTKNTPWRNDPLSFPVKATAIPLDKIVKSEKFEPKKYNVIAKSNKDGVTKEELFYMKKTDIWQKAYYKNTDLEAVAEYQDKIDEINNKLPEIDENIWAKIKSISTITKSQWQKGKVLVNTNNPNNYHVVKAGVEAGMYFFAWNLVRMIIEIERPINNLFIKDHHLLSVLLVAMTALFGIVLAVIAQFVAPYLFRKPGFIFEKQYFYTEDAAKAAAGTKVVKSEDNNEKISKIKLKEQKAKEKLDKTLKKDK